MSIPVYHSVERLVTVVGHCELCWHVQQQRWYVPALQQDMHYGWSLFCWNCCEALCYAHDRGNLKVDWCDECRTSRIFVDAGFKTGYACNVCMYNKGVGLIQKFLHDYKRMQMDLGKYVGWLAYPEEYVRNVRRYSGPNGEGLGPDYDWEGESAMSHNRRCRRHHSIGQLAKTRTRTPKPKQRRSKTRR